MADFRLLRDAKPWFKALTAKDGGFAIDFEIYYFCLMAGLASGKKRAELSTTETAELVQHFPGRYKERGKVIVGLFLARYLSSLGVDLKDKKQAHHQISMIISPTSPNYLSDEGMKELNKYAAGGYDEIIEWFEDSPRTLESFLRTFASKVNIKMQPIPI